MLAFFVMLFTTPVTQTHPQDWRLVAASPDSMFAVDIGNVATVGGNKRFWGTSVHDQPEDGYVQSIGLQEIDCEERRVRTLQSSFFRANGSAVEGAEAGSWAYIVPSTINEANAEAVCDGVLPQGEGFRSAAAFLTFARSYYAAKTERP